MKPELLCGVMRVELPWEWRGVPPPTLETLEETKHVSSKPPQPILERRMVVRWEDK